MTAIAYPHPALSVDSVVFGLDGGDLKVLLIQRDSEPFAGRWALPGGFVLADEGLDDAARRKLAEETGVDRLFLEQLYTFGRPDRDPRERVVSVAYWAIVELFTHPVRPRSGAERAAWFEVDDLPPLAFDHADMVDMARERLRGKIHYEPLAFTFLPEKFTLTQVQRLYEIILGQGLDKRNFRKKLLSLGILEALEELQVDVAHRAAQYYRFDREAWERLKAEGARFSL